MTPGNKVLYAHYIPGNGQPFYIGIGSEKRPRQKGRNPYWHNHIAAHGGKYLVRILEAGLATKQARALEISYIARYQPCCNLTGGGEGLNRATPELRKRMSEAVKATYASPEVRRRLSEAQKAGWANPKLRAEHSDKMRKILAQPEIREKVSAAVKASWTPERRARQSAALKARWQAPEQCRRIGRKKKTKN